MLKPIILTFDDNAFNHYYNVFPLLKKYKMKATYAYITSQKYTKNSDDENKKIIEEMKSYGIEFASHTHTHIDLLYSNQNKSKEDLYNSLDSLKSYDILYPGLVCPYNRVNDNIIKEFSNKFKYIVHKSFSVSNFEIFPNLENASKFNLVRLEFPTRDHPSENILKFYNILYNLENNDIPIIMFHNICNHDINMQVDINTFNNFLFFIQNYNFKTYTISEVIDYIER